MANGLPPRFAQLRLRDLTLIEHIDELGSLTEAAARLHVTQSAITQALQSVEEGFGVALVERGRLRGQRGVRLTPAGRAALDHLRIARQHLSRALDAAADPGAPALRLGALPLALEQPLPDALERLRRRLPAVRIHLSEATVPELWRRLEAAEFDAIVCRLPALSEHPRLPAGVAHRELGRDAMVVVCAREHPLARRRRPRLDRLLEHDWVLPPEGAYARLLVEQVFVRAGLSAPRVAVTSGNYHANLRLAARGSLLAVAPQSALAVVGKVLALQVVPIDWGPEHAALHLAWREANLVNPALGLLLDCF